MSRKTLTLAVTGAATALGIALAPSIAHATCDEPFGYNATVSGSTVTICVTGFTLEWGTPYGCARQGPYQPMVRQNVATGEDVVLPDFCAPRVDATFGCWVDECVPPGEYRYGLEYLPECCRNCAETRNYTTVTVGGNDAGPVTDGGASCTRSPSNPGPSPEDAGALAWSDGAVLCGPGPECVQTPEPDASSPDASSDGSESSSSSSGSCSIDAPIGVGAAGGGWALFVAIAAALGRRARRR